MNRKKIIHGAALMLAAAVAIFVIFAVTGCDTAASNGGGGVHGDLSTWSGTNEGDDPDCFSSLTIGFNTDGTFEWYQTCEYTGESEVETINCKGTYTGDVTASNAIIVLTITQYYDEGEWVSDTDSEDLEIVDGTMYWEGHILTKK